MSTALMDRSLLDKNIHEIDFTALDPLEELRKINPKFMEYYDKLKGNERISWLKSYSINFPVEEALVQIALDKMMPVKLNQTEENRVRRAMAEEAAKGIEIDTPEKEAEWEAKIQEARLKDLEVAKQAKAQRAAGLTGDPKNIEPSPEEGLSEIGGLDDKSIEKLHAAEIKTVAAFNELSAEQLLEICGPIVAEKFKK